MDRAVSDVSHAAVAAKTRGEKTPRETIPGPGDDTLAETPAYDLIELLFFAYRDFVSDADRILEDYGFGRAHHRVLHFVDRQPGLTIAELLDILRITKQSLNRVLKELIEKDFVESRTGTADRRQRLLYTTQQGRELALRLAELQTRRIMRALAATGADAKVAASRYLLAMIDAHDRDHVARIVFGAEKA
jgi:DNA-binding MarR family transcriptional regulator